MQDTESLFPIVWRRTDRWIFPPDLRVFIMLPAPRKKTGDIMNLQQTTTNSNVFGAVEDDGGILVSGVRKS